VYEPDLLVSLSFHNMPADLLRDFASLVVKPYFKGNVNEAIRQLMTRAVADEELLQARVRRNQL
jgi:hypothetical protein